MCGIWMYLQGKGPTPSPEAVAAALAALKPRGPEHTALVDLSGVQLGFTRLAINGLTPLGHQPFQLDGRALVCNGEIYNYRDLAKRHGLDIPEGTSDCFVLLPLLARMTAKEFCRTLDGVFAFAAYDAATQEVWVARDPYGVRPLFVATYEEGKGGLCVASELKGLLPGYESVAPFPPGTYRRYRKDGTLLEDCRYHAIPHTSIAGFSPPGRWEESKHALRAALTAAVKKRVVCDRPIGALLSGGVDSSLVAALAAAELKAAGKGQPLHTFSIGMPGSTDLVYAQKVADHIGSIHHTIVKTREEFLAAIPEVIRAAETYDITSVRASVGNYLVGKYIRETTDIKVVLNGDGSDEIGGGYLYFYAAPSDEAFESETERLLEEIHLYDVLRSDRGMAANGLEARTPFLDKNVVATWKSIHSEYRRPRKGTDEKTSMIEKRVLREAFEPGFTLPIDVLYRKKEAFSDGVAAATEAPWYQIADDPSVDLAAYASLHNPPTTQEALRYRRLFVDAYGEVATRVIPRMWMPRFVAGATDPSARTLALYK
jgi:asparagine synthase (glutamine-hydrolysing)